MSYNNNRIILQNRIYTYKGTNPTLLKQGWCNFQNNMCYCSLWKVTNQFPLHSFFLYIIYMQKRFKLKDDKESNSPRNAISFPTKNSQKIVFTYLFHKLYICLGDLRTLQAAVIWWKGSQAHPGLKCYSVSMYVYNGFFSPLRLPRRLATAIFE